MDLCILDFKIKAPFNIRLSWFFFFFQDFLFFSAQTTAIEKTTVIINILIYYVDLALPTNGFITQIHLIHT